MKRNDIEFHNGSINHTKQLSDIQKNVLIGSLYGDFSLNSSAINSRISGIHCLEQEEYLLWKLSFFNNINITTYYHNPKPDKRTNKVYKGIGFTSEYNSCFNEFKEMYENGNKEITYNLLSKYYNDLSLAIHFMDDGTKTKSSYSLATNCFNNNSLEIFQRFLKDKFNIETNIWKSSNVLYIKAKSRSTFEKVISPYIHKSMQYKLITSPCKIG